jgi:hypothetical protein
MGKVYEALKKAEAERNRSAVALAAIDGTAAAHPDNNKAPAPDAFDFMDYSLSAPSAAEAQQSHQQATREAAAREALVRPASEVSLDLTRIDPHLVAFYECDPRASDQYNKLAVSLIAGATERPLACSAAAEL